MLATDLATVGVGIVTVSGAGLGFWRWGWPRLRKRRAVRAAIYEVLVGCDAEPPNPITGDRGRPARKPLAQIVDEIHHELHPNGGSSMKDALARIEEGQSRQDERLDVLEHSVSGALTATTRTAETAVSAIETAIHATPPEA